MTFTDVNAKVAGESSKSDTASTTTATEQNQIWSTILQEVQNSTKKTPPPKSLILLGDNESGRSTLVSRLKGVENISKGIGLEYHYIEIRDEDRDDTPKLGVWIPDGDGACTGLLKCALNETNFEHTVVAFVVSMSSPWSIMDSLKKWSNILTEHIKKLNISKEKREEYLRQQRRIFQTYQEPDESLQALNAAAKKTGPATIATPSSAKPDEAQNDDDALLPLDPAILTKNLGIPVVVIVTKSDYISVLDKENEYRIEHFDFIQYHIRRFCLEYGAALFYTTVKDKRTYDKLYKYLIHKLYSYPFNFPSSVVDRESIFIPSGWDNESKINILLENSTTIKSDSDYSEIIAKPSIRKPLQRDVETVVAIEDQEFLSKLQILLNKATTPTVKTDEISNAQTITSAANPGTPSMKPAHKPTAATKSSNPNAPDSTNLKNFFQNLLNKNVSAPNAATPNQAAAQSAAPAEGQPPANQPSESNA